MMRYSLYALILCLSLAKGASAMKPPQKMHFADTSKTNVHVRHVVAGTALIGLGSVGLTDYYHRNVNMPLRDYLAELRQNDFYHADDYIQYLPAVSTMLLNLLPRYRSGWQDKLLLLSTAVLAETAIVNITKYSVGSLRPDNSNRSSFPSGHTATAFMGAELVRMEYGPWWGTAAYLTAAGVGFLRMYNNRHWSNDVLAGAGAGILCARIAYWLLPWEQKQLGKISFLPYFAPYAEGGMASGIALNYKF